MIRTWKELAHQILDMPEDVQEDDAVVEVPDGKYIFYMTVSPEGVIFNRNNELCRTILQLRK